MIVSPPPLQFFADLDFYVSPVSSLQFEFHNNPVEQVAFSLRERKYIFNVCYKPNEMVANFFILSHYIVLNILLCNVRKLWKCSLS